MQHVSEPLERVVGSLSVPVKRCAACGGAVNGADHLCDHCESAGHEPLVLPGVEPDPRRVRSAA